MGRENAFYSGAPDQGRLCRFAAPSRRAHILANPTRAGNRVWLIVCLLNSTAGE